MCQKAIVKQLHEPKLHGMGQPWRGPIFHTQTISNFARIYGVIRSRQSTLFKKAVTFNLQGINSQNSILGFQNQFFCGHGVDYRTTFNVCIQLSYMHNIETIIKFPIKTCLISHHSSLFHACKVNLKFATSLGMLISRPH